MIFPTDFPSVYPDLGDPTIKKKVKIKKKKEKVTYENKTGQGVAEGEKTHCFSL